MSIYFIDIIYSGVITETSEEHQLLKNYPTGMAQYSFKFDYSNKGTIKIYFIKINKLI